MRDPARLSLAVVPLVTMAVAWSAAVPAQTVVPLPLAPFHSVILSGGGTVILRRGAAQRVGLVRGSLRHTRVAVAADWLAIDGCARDCPPDYRLEIEVVTPEIAGLAVENGGTIESRDGFPPQPAITVGVDQGGTIDIRFLAVSTVDAVVNQGGLILTKPLGSLVASVTSGGNITYWGDPVVRPSIRLGGVVVQGTAADADKPLSELNPGLRPVPPFAPVPPVPPVPPAR